MLYVHQTHQHLYNTSQTGFWITFFPAKYSNFIPELSIQKTRNGRPLRSPGKHDLIAAAVAFVAPGIVAAADCTRYTAQADDTRAVLADSPAGMAAPVQAAHMAGYRAIAAAAGSMAAAVAVATNCPCSSWNSSSRTNQRRSGSAPGSQKGSARQRVRP